MTLNKLPDGTDSPKFECVVEGMDGRRAVLVAQEWWYNGKRVQTIEATAHDYFYTAFDKAPFKIKSCKRLEGRDLLRETGVKWIEPDDYEG